MAIQKVEQLISIVLEPKYDVWINPYTGILLYSKNDSKITIHNKIALLDKLPPDFILELPFGTITDIAFHTKFFCISFSSGRIALVDNISYSMTLLKKNIKKSINLLSISPGGQYLIVYTEDDKLNVIDILKDKIIKDYKLKDIVITGLEWLTDSKFIYVTQTGSIYYWDQNKGKEIKVIKDAHNSNILSLTKHPRSIYTIITGDSKGEIRIWDLDENKIYPDLINSFTDIRTEITSLASSPHGDIFLSGDINGVIRIFDMRNPRNEKPLIYLSTEENIREIIASYQDGEFLVVYNSGSIKLFQGFSIEQISAEFQNFQSGIEIFNQKIEKLPDWLISGGLDVVLPNEISQIERTLDLASKMLSPTLLEKFNNTLMQENFQKFFKKPIELETKLKITIEKTRALIQEQKEQLDKKTEYSKKIQQDLINYFSNMKPGKISLDQIAIYFNTDQETLVPILQNLEQQKMINGSLKSEYSGYFFEIYAERTDDHVQRDEKTELNFITCHKCGSDYDIELKTCPNCHTDSILCVSCSKFIQKRQMIINCPNCQSYFHLACFESKVKVFGRCPKCHESVNFNALIRKSVNEQKQQDRIVSGLSRLVNKKSKYHKKDESEDHDEGLFDF